MTNLRSYTLALLSWILLLGLHILPSGAWAMSTDEERRLGKEFVLKAKEHFEFLEEPYPLMFLKELVDLLYEQETNKPFDISIYLLKKGDLNAFAAPGGNLFLFTGLIERLEDLDRLSGVIAHELAHVSFRHISNKISQSYKSGLATLGGMLLGALVGGAPGEAIMAGSMAAGVQMQLAYSREDERQADQLGLRYMYEAGFDPRALIQLHKELQRETHFAGEKIPPYLLTHPTTAERMAKLDSMIAELKDLKRNPKGEKLKESYPFIRAIIVAWTRETDDAVSFYEGMLKKYPRAPEYLFGLGVAKMRERDYRTAKRYFLEAVQLAPHIQLLKTYLAVAFLESGDPETAQRYLKEVLAQNEEDYYAHYLMAEASMDRGDDQTSLVYLRRLIYLGNKVGYLNPDVYYKLANILGRQGKTDLAHFNLGLYYLKSGDPKKASFHLDKAMSITADYKLKEEIKELLKETKTQR